MKNILIFGAVLIVVLTGVLFLLEPKQTAQEAETAENKEIQKEETTNTVPVVEEEVPPKNSDASRIALPAEKQVDVPLSKLKVANFTGKLEKVDTGCFADGECSVVVDGKHVTAIIGWSQATVGSVQGVDGFGDLESHIGAEVAVYAQDTSDGKYTLYGNEGFYIKLIK